MDSIWIIAAIVIAILVIGVGYSQRPKTKKNIKTIQTTPNAITNTESSIQQTPTTEVLVEETVSEEILGEKQTVTKPVSVEPTQTMETAEFTNETITTHTQQEEMPTVTIQNIEVPVQVEQEISLTNVKGVGEKRAIQLNALGINNAKELAQASVEDLAMNLKISPKIAAKLIEAAKQQ
ncbi:MAG: helix-hairpin-helix domain-containing protein [Candidatus Bathyarchaeota archaeon]|nr:helix-hairpin-helix domain-containing protein [Candidatus Termiticorpusculum sp.]